MSTPTMGAYWRVIAYGSIVGVALSIGILNLYYLIFASEYTLQSFGDAARWGTLLGLVTSAFVIVGTIAFARRLGTRWSRGLFITLSVVSPVAGWLGLGIVNGLLVSWIFFFGFPLIAAVSGVMAGIVATVSMFFIPQPETPEEDTASTDNPLSALDVDF
jgi:MFS family permease